MLFSKKIAYRIKKYHPKGGLDKLATIMLILLGFNHEKVQHHTEYLALLAERVARRMKKDVKAAFFAAIFHDIAKLVYPREYFDGRNITAEEYEHIKKHAVMVFLALKDSFLFSALCSGFHHAMYAGGYGISINDIPKNLGLWTVKKILEISAIIAVCDDVSASMRGTELKDESGKGLTLEERLRKKFPNDHEIVRIALEESKKI